VWDGGRKRGRGGTREQGGEKIEGRGNLIGKQGEGVGSRYKEGWEESEKGSGEGGGTAGREIRRREKRMGGGGGGGVSARSVGRSWGLRDSWKVRLG